MQAGTTGREIRGSSACGHAGVQAAAKGAMKQGDRQSYPHTLRSPAVGLGQRACGERGFQHPLLAAAVKAQQLVAPPHPHPLAAGPGKAGGQWGEGFG